MTIQPGTSGDTVDRGMAATIFAAPNTLQSMNTGFVAGLGCGSDDKEHPHGSGEGKEQVDR
jgi:hypothetical protein